MTKYRNVWRDKKISAILNKMRYTRNEILDRTGGSIQVK